MWPYHTLEIYGFLHVVEGMLGYLNQETILMVYQYPGQGEGAKLKVEFFSRGKVTWPPPPMARLLGHYQNGHLLKVGPHLPNTSAKTAEVDLLYRLAVCAAHHPWRT